MCEEKKTENGNNKYIAQFTDIICCRVSAFSYTSNTETILPYT